MGKFMKRVREEKVDNGSKKRRSPTTTTTPSDEIATIFQPNHREFARK
jgi:hypothetical protein